ncbi:hypothetical protein [Rhizobium halophytocola]
MASAAMPVTGHQGIAAHVMPMADEGLQRLAMVDCAHEAAMLPAAVEHGEGSKGKRPGHLASGHCAACQTLAAAIAFPQGWRFGRSPNAIEIIRLLQSTPPTPPDRPPRA